MNIPIVLITMIIGGVYLTQLNGVSTSVLANDLVSVDLGAGYWYTFNCTYSLCFPSDSSSHNRNPVATDTIGLTRYRSVWLKKKIWSFGGYGNFSNCGRCAYNSRAVRVLDPVTLQASEVNAPNGPEPRGLHCMLAVNDKEFMVIAGISEFVIDSLGNTSPRTRFVLLYLLLLLF